MSTPLENLLSRLDKVRSHGSEHEALCPAHDDRKPSLGIKETDDGVLLVKCRVGCGTHDVLAAIGLGIADLYPNHLRKGRKGAPIDPDAAARIEQAKAARRAQRTKEISSRVQDARNAWNASCPIALEDPAPAQAWARTYLTSRGSGGLDAAIAAGARVLPDTNKASWNPDNQARAHCVLWPMRDPRSGDVVGVQREWGRGHKNKKMMGRHMVPIDPATPDVLHSAYLRFPGTRDTLYICEGQITAAAVATATGARTIALFDTAGISKPPRPVIERAIRDGATKIIVAGDSGAAGEKATIEGLRAIQTWGLEPTQIIWTVPPEGKDWADILERDGQEAVRAALGAGVRPIPAPEKKATASVWSIQAWRPAAEPVIPAATVPVDQAREIIKQGVQMMVSDYINWLAELDERKEEGKKGRLPMAKPWLFKPTTGAGKTTAIKALIDNATLLAARGAVLALVPDHSQSDSYENDGWWHYHGRNQDPNNPGYCPNYKEMMEAVAQHHIPQAEFCHKCPNGLKWAGKPENIQDLARMGYAGEKLAQLESCVWQQHLRDTMKARFVVAPAGSYSETLASWAHKGLDKSGEKEMRPRLVTVDERVQVAQPIAVGLQDIDLWARRTADTLRGLEGIQAKVDAVNTVVGASPIEAIRKQEDDRKARIESAKAALNLFQTLSQEMAGLVGKEGRISISPDLLASVQKITDIDDDEVTSWERLEFNRDGSLKLTPLRAAWAIRQTLEYGDGHVKEGKLHISGVRPLIERIGKKPIVFFDATPDPIIVDSVREHGGHIVQALAQQHVKIIRKPGRFWGLTPFGKEAKPGHRQRAIQQYKALRALHPHAVLLVHKKVRVLIDPDGTDELLGHWGADHRAHDRWAGRDLVIIGSFFPPMDDWRGLYQAARVSALVAGAPATAWPEWPDNMQMETGAWIKEGTHEVQSMLPMPTSQQIRKWLLDTITSETVQAIGRVRGANLDPAHPVTVTIYGGVPLAGLGEHGLTVDNYEADAPEIGESRSGRAMDARQAISSALTAGQRTIRAIQVWVKERFRITVGVDRVRSVMRALEAAARTTGDDIEAIYRKVATRADAYLHSAKGDLETAVTAAVVAQDWEAAELLDIPAQAQTARPTPTGPPAAA